MKISVVEGNGFGTSWRLLLCVVFCGGIGLYQAMIGTHRASGVGFCVWEGGKMSRAGPGKRKAQFNDVRLFGVDFVLRLCFNVHDVQRRQNEDFGSSIQSNLVRY
jgi:hypothetical protein